MTSLNWADMNTTPADLPANMPRSFATEWAWRMRSIRVMLEG